MLRSKPGKASEREPVVSKLKGAVKGKKREPKTPWTTLMNGTEKETGDIWTAVGTHIHVNAH